MRANVSNIKKLIDEKFSGNNALFAKTIGVERSQVSTLLNHGGSVGAKFFGGLIAYCDLNKLNFREYIFLPTSVQKNDTNYNN